MARDTRSKEAIVTTPSALSTLLSLADPTHPQRCLAVATVMAYVTVSNRRLQQLALRDMEVSVDDWERLKKLTKVRACECVRACW